MPRNPLEQDNSYSTVKGLPRPQKIAVVVLALFAILIIVFWALQFRSQLNKPFQVETKKTNTESIIIDPRQQDTDSDGLSDYDELNVYKTSPYLEDSDSDGLTDKQEVDQGTDPNCPTGKQCNVPLEIPDQTITQSTFSLPDELTTSEAENILQNALGGTIDANSLRQLLIQSGADQATLDQISDEDLMKSYQETLEKQDNQ